MKKIRLGCSDLSALQLGVGCINFGTLTDEKTAFDIIIDCYLEKGGMSWVLKYITEQYGGSAALFTTNSIEHLCANMSIYD